MLSLGRHGAISLTKRLISLTDAMISAKQREAVAREKVIQCSLKCAADNFAQEAEDPGWESDMHDDFLRHAVKEYVSEMNFVKQLEQKEKEEAIIELAKQQQERID